MSAALQGQAAQVLAPSRSGIINDVSREIVDTIADQLALDDEAQSDVQREADLEEAEWMLGVIRAAGFKLVSVTS